MFRISLRNLLANKLRLLLTIAAVTVGVTFVSGTFVLSDTMVKAFGELYDGLTAGTDVVVKSEAAFDADVATTGGQVRPLDQGMVRRVREVPGRGRRRGGGVRLRAGHRRSRRPGPARRRPHDRDEPHRATAAWPGPRPSARAGRPPGPHEMALDARTAGTAGYALGDTVDVVLQDGRRTFTLVGIIGFGDTDSLLGATLAGFDLPTAQRVLDKVGVVDEIDVRAADGHRAAARCVTGSPTVLPDGVQALTGEQVAADGTAAVRDSMGVFTTVLLVFAGVSVLVGSFVIWNTFNVLVAQRRREVALLRAVGATRRQVLTGVLVEAGGDRAGGRRARAAAGGRAWRPASGPCWS